MLPGKEPMRRQPRQRKSIYGVAFCFFPLLTDRFRVAIQLISRKSVSSFILKKSENSIMLAVLRRILSICPRQMIFFLMSKRKLPVSVHEKPAASDSSKSLLNFNQPMRSTDFAIRSQKRSLSSFSAAKVWQPSGAGRRRSATVMPDVSSPRISTLMTVGRTSMRVGSIT